MRPTRLKRSGWWCSKKDNVFTALATLTCSSVTYGFTSQGEWFRRRLMSIMKKEKFPLGLQISCGVTDSNLNHTGIYLYSKGKIMIHLTFDYKVGKFHCSTEEYKVLKNSSDCICRPTTWNGNTSISGDRQTLCPIRKRLALSKQNNDSTVRSDLHRLYIVSAYKTKKKYAENRL